MSYINPICYYINLLLMLCGSIMLFVSILYVFRFGHNNSSIILESVLMIIVLITFIFLILYRRTLYYEQDSKQLDTQSLYEINNESNLVGNGKLCCKLCRKHPVPKKYHLRKVHNLKNINEDDYFVCCGCIACIEIISKDYYAG